MFTIKVFNAVDIQMRGITWWGRGAAGRVQSSALETDSRAGALQGIRAPMREVGSVSTHF